MWDLWWTKWPWDRTFSELFGFSCQYYSILAPLEAVVQRHSTTSIDMNNNNNNNHNNGYAMTTATNLKAS
jgi:hypothetical protein